MAIDKEKLEGIVEECIEYIYEYEYDHNSDINSIYKNDPLHFDTGQPNFRVLNKDEYPE